MFEYQTPGVLNQAAPVQNTYYPILPETKLVELWGISINIEDADETLQVRLTLDGEILLSQAFAATHSTNYFIRRSLDAINQMAGLTIAATAYDQYRGPFLEGHTTMVEVRKTTALGAGNLTGIVQYGILK